MVSTKIIKSAQKGNQLSRLHLLKEIEVFVYRTAYHLLENENDAISASQQALTEIYKSLHLYQATEDFTIWIQRKVTTICIKTLTFTNHHRKLYKKA